MIKRVLPGGTIGVLGGGQLGRMMTFAAQQMGYRVHVFAQDHDSPTCQIADRKWIGPWSDTAQLASFAQSVDVITYEFENVPLSAAECVAEHAGVYPQITALAHAQHRGREKDFLRGCGIPVAPFARVESLADLEHAVQHIGAPSILKTVHGGYDGKGQVRLTSAADAAGAWAALNHHSAVLEGFVNFDAELSVVGARSSAGRCAFYGPILNEHAHHILDVSTAPAPLPEKVRQEALDIARTVLEQLDVIGVLCVEFFLDTSGRLLVNELAPRPHNSGHLTIDAHVTSQFEQQVRAVCGLALGSVEQWRPAAMANLLGDVWSAGEPNWSEVLAAGDVKLHLYGKRDPRPGRKMGHLTTFGPTAEEARERARAARAQLTHRGAVTSSTAL